MFLNAAAEVDPRTGFPPVNRPAFRRPTAVQPVPRTQFPVRPTPQQKLPPIAVHPVTKQPVVHPAQLPPFNFPDPQKSPAQFAQMWAQLMAKYPQIAARLKDLEAKFPQLQQMSAHNPVLATMFPQVGVSGFGDAGLTPLVPNPWGANFTPRPHAARPPKTPGTKHPHDPNFVFPPQFIAHLKALEAKRPELIPMIKRLEARFPQLQAALGGLGDDGIGPVTITPELTQATAADYIPWSIPVTPEFTQTTAADYMPSYVPPLVTVTPAVQMPSMSYYTPSAAATTQPAASVGPAPASPSTDWFRSDVLPVLQIAGGTLVSLVGAVTGQQQGITPGMPYGAVSAAGTLPGGITPQQYLAMTPAQQAMYKAQYPQSFSTAPSSGLASMFAGVDMTTVLIMGGLGIGAIMLMRK